jgi:hypothetical protein
MVSLEDNLPTTIAITATIVVNRDVIYGNISVA